MRNLSSWIEAGVIVRSHGVRGEVVAEIFCDLGEIFDEGLKVRLTDREGGESLVTVRRARKHHDRYILEFEGIATRDQVESYAQRKDMTMPEAERWLQANLGYEGS